LGTINLGDLEWKVVFLGESSELSPSWGELFTKSTPWSVVLHKPKASLRELVISLRQDYNVVIIDNGVFSNNKAAEHEAQ